MRLLRLAALVFVALACGAGACPHKGPGPGPEPAPGFDRKAMLTNLADEVILPTLRRFEEASGALQTACQAWASETPPSPTGEARMAAQGAWIAAMDAWQEAEVFQLGPAGDPMSSQGGGTPGGQGIRHEIYAWPFTAASPCGIDQLLVANEFRAGGYFNQRLVSVYGIDALEYVLFVPTRDNACAGVAAINNEGQWAALSDDEVWQRRADYCVAAAIHLAGDAARLLEAWEPGGGDFRGKLVSAGASGNPYESQAEAMDALYAALFYVELMVKDRKLAMPAGLHVDCTAQSCPQLAESPFARRGKEHLLANMRAFERLFLGKPGADEEEGLGFDDYLVAANAAELAERMRANTTAVIEALEAFEGTLHDALVHDVERVRALHGVVKELTDDLKSQLPAVLSLRVPQEGAGDND